MLLSVKDRRDYPEIEARHIEDLEQDKRTVDGSVLGAEKNAAMNGSG